MKRFGSLVVVALALGLLAGVPVAAEDGGPGAAYVRNLEFVGDRAVQLAGAIPADKYGWAPMEGVRNVAQAAMHMAGANYFFAGQMGTPPPEGVDPSGRESGSGEDEVVAALAASLEHRKTAFMAVEDPSKEMDIFGRPGTLEDMMMIAIGHVHEHFGQLIAYARSNEVVPPWSQPSDG